MRDPSPLQIQRQKRNAKNKHWEVKRLQSTARDNMSWWGGKRGRQAGFWLRGKIDEASRAAQGACTARPVQGREKFKVGSLTFVGGLLGAKDHDIEIPQIVFRGGRTDSRS